LKCFSSNQTYNSYHTSYNNRNQMSSYSRNTTNTSKSATAATTKTPNCGAYCKVCYDAGRTIAEYTSHYVKDQPGPDGKVVCPTLLNQACRNCSKTGHTSSYCPERRIPRREEPRREERYIPRESEHDDDRARSRREEPRREERYIPRERDISFNLLREDTERRERDIRHRDDSYHRQQDRQSKPWLQAALRPAVSASAAVTRRAPYAHPHGPRVRLNLEAPALSAASTTTTADVVAPAAAAIDVRKVNLQVKAKWGDEDNEQPFLFEATPQQMAAEFFNGLTTEKEDKLIAVSDNQNRLPWACSDDEN
jgi:hypothetical protein